MARPLKWAIRTLALLLVMAGVAWVLRPRSIPVDTAIVERSTLDATVTADGRTRVRNVFTVSAPVDGELQRIALKAGDAVNTSAVVAQLFPVSPRPLDVRSRAESVAAVASARAAVQRAEATQKEAAGALAHAESTLSTTKRLSTERVIAANDLEHAGHEVEIRRQALQASEAAVEEARADLQRAEAAASVSTTTQDGRSVTLVRTPSTGRVLRVLRESAGPVTAGTPLLEIGNTGEIEIAADFLTTDAMAIQSGARAAIRDWGNGSPITARVRRVEPAAFTKVSPLGLEEQRVTVLLDFTEPERVPFGHDYHVNVAVVVWTGTDVLTVPATALFRVGDAWAVYAIRNGRARLTRVTVGRGNATKVVIERGLVAGDRVVVQPSDALQDGAAVQALAPER